MKTISYGRQYIDNDDIDAVIKTLKSDYLTQGPKISEFENVLARYHNCKYAVTFCNGTAALHGAYFASGIAKGDEFITSDITFVASSNAGIYMGATPVLCDIDKFSYNIDIEQIKDKITSKTKVITPVSYAGNLVNIKKIKEIIGDRNITIIHDAAHAIGAKINGYGICDFADMAMVSFHPVKHVTTGEGGVILTNNEKLYKKLLLFRTHGITKNKSDFIYNNDDPWYYEMQELGYNYRMSDIQAALGISQMKKLDNSIKKRNEIAIIYNNAFKNISWITTPKNDFDENNIHSYHLYPVLISKEADRRKFFDYMRSKNIWVQVHYIPVSYMPYYIKNYGYKKGDFPVSEDFYSKEVSLPMYPTLSAQEQNYVIECIQKYKN